MGDSRIEIVAAPGAGIEPRVKLFAGDGRELALFLAFEPGYLGGVPVATVRDPTPFSQPTEFAATILWGDGGRSAGAIRRRGMSFEVVGSHRYRRAGLYRVVVRIAEKAGVRRAVVRSTIRVR